MAGRFIYAVHTPMLVKTGFQRLASLLLLSLTATVAARAASNPQWVEVRSPNFVVITDSNEAKARQLAGQFERMRSFFRAELPHAGGDAGLPITVFALKDRKGFTALEPAAYLAKGSLPLAGLFLQTQDRNYILLRLDTETQNPYSVVYHEYTHFITRKAAWLPLWLSEGLAEFYQNTDIEDKSVRLGQPSADDILFLRENRLIPLPTLFAVDHSSPYYHDEQKGSIFYSEAWALTHMLEITDFDNKTHRLTDYTHLLAKNVDPILAAQQAFGDLSKLQKELQNYVNGQQYKLFKLNTAFTADNASFTARPLSLPEVNAARADVLAHDDRRAEADALLETVLRDDPKNPLAYETRGELAYRDHHIEAARTAYAEAVKLGSSSYLAYFHYATLSMMANAAGADDPTIETSLRQSIKLEPSFAPAYDALAQYFGRRNENFAEANLLSTKASELEPTEIRYRLNRASLLTQEKNFESALSVLNAALRISTTSADKQQVQSRIDQINEYQATLKRPRSLNGSNVTSTDDSGPTVIVADPPEATPKVFPTAAPGAPHRTAKGIIQNVACSYPTAITLTLDQPAKKLSLFAPNMYKLTYSTANYTPTSDMDPCKTMSGMKAQVEFNEVSDPVYAGQIIGILLSK